MSIGPGQSLLHYRLVEKLGEGGMGQVWKALDTTLDREVAVKLLPDVFAGDPERLARFDREAKTLAALNHPGIAAVYGLHEVPSEDPARPALRFIAMELVPGEDLAQRLRRGPLEVDDALDVARQIADALEAAHEQGVVHRDLKPANVKRTPEGKIKILDLGLAKALAPDTAVDGAASASLSPTVTSAGTVVGTLLGTAAYMSPEQARGRPVDRRADIWAFGVVCFEMLTGRALFEGESVTDVLAAVVREDPDWSRLPGGVPRRVVDLLRRCLDRDVRRRLRDIGEARVVLEDPASGEGTPEGDAPPQATSRGVSWPLAAAGAIGLAAVAALAVGLWQPFAGPAPAPDSLRLGFPMPPGRVLPWQFPRLDVSSDGRTIAYTALEAGQSRIYLLSLDAFGPAPVEGTEGGSGPLLSPDGRWLAFFRSSDLYRVPVEGGTPQLVAKGTVWDRDGAWLSADEVILGGGASDATTRRGLRTVPASGGAIRPASQPADEDEIHDAPTVLPDGSVLFSVLGGRGGGTLARFVPASGTWESLGVPGSKGWWVDGGYLVVYEAPAYKAYRFDLASGRALGGPANVLLDAQDDSLAISASGAAAYVSRAQQGGTTVVAVSRDGTVTPLIAEPGAYRWPRVSPDGKRIALGVTAQDEPQRLWVYEIGSNRRTPLGGPNPANSEPVWSPDGRRVLMSAQAVPDGLALQPADGSRPPVELWAPEFDPWPTDWSPTGHVAFYGTSGPDMDIWVLDLGGAEPEARLAVGGAGDQRLAEFSPDGRWLAYSSSESGRMSVYVQPFPELDRRWTVSAEGGTDPKWAPDGSDIYYRHEDGVYAVAVEYGEQDGESVSFGDRVRRMQEIARGGVAAGELRLGPPELLFSGIYAHDPNGDQSWDLMPDGRFVLVLPEALERRELRVVTRLGKEIEEALRGR